MAYSKRILIRSAVVFGACAVFAGCSTVESLTFSIVQNQPRSDECPGELTTDTTQSQPFGTLDVLGLQAVNVPKTYEIRPLLRNQLASNVVSGSERNRVMLKRFDVELILDERFEGLGDVPEDGFRFSIDTGGPLLDAGGLLATQITIIPPTLGAALRVPQGQTYQINALVTAVADHGGSDMSSNEFLFPLSVCYGCLVEFTEACPTNADQVQPNPCGIPQDVAVSCCMRDGAFVCLSADEVGTEPAAAEG